MSFNENPNVGVFCRANDTVGFIQKGLTKKVKKTVSSVLDVRLVELNIAEATIVGSLLVMNSSGAVVCDFVDADSLSVIRDQGFDVFIVSDKLNAAGNDILVNDHGCLVHPDIKDRTMKEVGSVFGVPVFRGTIGDLKTVGMSAVVTNKGCLCHPKASDEEIRFLERVFDVDVLIGTVNHGSPVIGSGLVANVNGAIIGNRTTGIEMGRIEEALGFLN